MSSPHTTNQPFNITVETLNIWGLLIVSRSRFPRVRHLGEYLRHCTADVVLLQEVWVEEDASLLIESAARGGLEHGVHFKSGVFGSGLVTLSRYPIIKTSFFCYTAAGDPAAIACGDFYAGKGVGWAMVDTPGGAFHVYNTHIHANYSHSYSQASTLAGVSITVPSDAFAAFRISQIWELTQFIKMTSLMDSHGIILGGDLNSKPDTLEIMLLKAELPQLKDCWDELHPNENGFTCRAPGNTYKSYRQVPERIDFIWTTLNPQACNLVLKTTSDGFSYSDHFGVQAHLNTSLYPPPSPLSIPQVFNVALDIIDSGIINMGRKAVWSLGLSCLVWLVACVVVSILVSRPEQSLPISLPPLVLVIFLCSLSVPLLFVAGLIWYFTQQRSLMQISTQLRTYIRYEVQQGR